MPDFTGLGRAGVRRRGRLLAGLAAVPLGLAGLAAQALVPAPAAQAATTTTFIYTGAEQTYTVPAGTTAVTITAVGAPGGSTIFGSPIAAGGDGAAVQATVPLPPGTGTLYVEVGGIGGESSFSGGAAGGFNGGGGNSTSGGGGGGASDVRTCSRETCSDLSTDDTRLVVAGGGGGVGLQSGNGGTAGDSTVTGAGNGADAGGCPPSGMQPGANGGFGGPAGLGGTGDGAPPTAGDPGALGQGGSGGGDGGGGGGGYFGGGGGGNAGFPNCVGGAGGAGSSFWVPNATGTSMSKDTAGKPEVTITPVTPAPDLALTDSAPATAISGQPYSYTLTATSTGGADASSVAVTDTLPASVHFNSAAATQGSCTRIPPSSPPKTKGGTVTCTAGTLAAGTSVTITISVTPTTPGTVSDHAQVTASDVTADGDDTATAATTVTGT